jgi:hypothetical protein
MKRKIMKKRFIFAKVLLSVLAGCAMGWTLASPARAQQPVNIALGKLATFSPSPNYALCTDPDDNKQLTDGKYSSEGKLSEVENTTSIWVQKGTVGWQYASPVIITIDLGAVQPISGAAFSTAAGRADVNWPLAIQVAVSDDNEAWHVAGDLLQLSRKNGAPPAEGYGTFKYVTRDLHTRGRYISFAVVGIPFVFVDEVEVYKGDDAWLAQQLPAKPAPDLKSLVAQTLNTFYGKRRLNADIDAIRAEVQQSPLSGKRKSTFEARLDQDAAATAQMEPLPADFKTILPLNNIHRSILAVHGEFLAAQGQKPLTVWKQQRYAWLPLLAKPNLNNKMQLDFSMLRDQFRSDNLLLSNASGKAQTITLQVKNPPRGASSGWLQVDAVAWTDTMQGTPVADALLPLDEKNGVYQLEIPAGMTRKIWFTVDSSKVPAGITKSTFVVNANGQQISVPFNMNISAIAMNKPRLSLGVWDYTNGNGYPAITPQNRASAIEMMRSHFVDSPWATNTVLSFPAASAFDAEGNLKAPLKFSELDAWVKMWPGARHYFVFANVPDHFAGTLMGTTEFNARVGSWVKVLSAHIKELNLQPQQLGLLLVDEPRNDKMDAIIAAWAKAINAAAPELTLFEDPNWLRPDQAGIQDAITQIDILSPQFPIYKRGGAPVQKYFEDLRAAGKTLWFYQCTGPVRSYDPQGYYRYQAWNAFALGATGEQFWAFGDTAKAPTSWNEYATSYGSFAPAFIDTDTVYNSVHWDAVREGVEDYEELAMLQDAINKSSNMAWKQQARQVLDEAIKTVTGIWKTPVYDYDWQKKSDAELADAQLRRVRVLLEQTNN